MKNNTPSIPPENYFQFGKEEMFAQHPKPPQDQEKTIDILKNEIKKLIEQLLEQRNNFAHVLSERNRIINSLTEENIMLRKDYDKIIEQNGILMSSIASKIQQFYNFCQLPLYQLAEENHKLKIEHEEVRKKNKELEETITTLQNLLKISSSFEQNNTENTQSQDNQIFNLLHQQWEENYDNFSALSQKFFKKIIEPENSQNLDVSDNRYHFFNTSTQPSTPTNLGGSTQTLFLPEPH